jgi:hypothetical protein
MSHSIPITVIRKGNDLSPNSKNSENWTVIPSKDQVFIYAFREQEADQGLSTCEKSGWCLQSTAVQALARLPDLNEVGFVCVYIPTDAETAKIQHLVQQLIKVGKRKSFTVASMIAPLTAQECFSAFGPEANTSNKFATAVFRPVSVYRPLRARQRSFERCLKSDRSSRLVCAI